MNRVDVSRIKMDPALQPRTGVDFSVVAEYAEHYATGVVMAPIVVFRDDANVLWLADGFHRVNAAQSANVSHVEAEIRTGTRSDAIWYSASANKAHGLPRRNTDKRRAVEMALKCEKSRGLSDRAIAEHCGVHHDLVGEVRKSITVSESDTRGSSPRIGKDGKKQAPSSKAKSEAGKASAAKRAEAKAAVAPPPEPDIKPEPRAPRPQAKQPIAADSEAVRTAIKVMVALLPSERDAVIAQLAAMGLLSERAA